MNCRSHYLSSRAISVAIFNGLGRLLRRRLLAMTGTITILLFLAFTFTLFASPTFAQTPAAPLPSALPLMLSPLPPTVLPTSPLYTDLLVNNLFHSFSCLAVGQSVIGAPCLTYQVTKNAQGALQSVPMLSQVNLSGGTLGAVTGVIGALYQNPPVRTADYLASVGQDFGIVKEANAQVTGSGEKVLSPIISLWQVSRNISYVIMIIIFVVIGLMVMFRNKINPQTVITAQAALPGLVIGLILITFSYFLAGLISDMAFVGTNVVGYYFSAVRGQTDNPQDLLRDTSLESLLSIFGQFAGIVDNSKAEGVASTIIDKMGSGAADKVRLLVGFFAAQFIAPLAGGTAAIAPPWGLIISAFLPVVLGGTAAANPPFVLGYLLSFIATLALVYQMIKLFLRLISSYLTIIFLTITAPFQFLFASLPGRQGVATGWILNMLANILVFPTVLAVLYFVAFILGDKNYGPLKISNLQQIEHTTVVPVAYAAQIKVVDSRTFPLFGGLSLEFIQMILAFGALMALPAIPDLVVKAVGRAGQAGQLIGQEISGGIGQGRQYAGQFQGAASGSAGNLKRSLVGDSTYYRTDTGWIKHTTSPNLIGHFFGGEKLTKAGKPGSSSASGIPR